MSSASDTSARAATTQKSAIEYAADGEVFRWDPGEHVDQCSRHPIAPPDRSHYSNRLPEGDLPGYGEEYDDCGDSQPHFCGECGDPIPVGRTCRRRECPRCAPSWCMDRAIRIGAKFEATRRYLYKSRGSSPKFHHLTFSPPDGFAVARDDARAAATEIIKEACDQLGIDGGVILYHPYRGEGDDDRGFWKEVQFSGNEWGETREKLEHSPHFHVIAVANFVPGGQFTKRFYEKTGWTYKRITKGGDDSESNVSIYDEYDLSRVLTYALSHTAPIGSDTYRYFGQVANMAANDACTAKIDDAVRSVAPKTLGIPYRSARCAREVDPSESGNGDAAGHSDPEFSAGEGPDQNHCGGAILHISKAPEHLVDPDWRESAPNSGKLAGVFGSILRTIAEDRPPPD